MKHLWEVDHAYYCNLGNYFSNDCGSEFRSWAEFMSAEGDADKDYNLLFRWDWELDEGSAYPDDPNYRGGTLSLFYMGQRKGLYRFVTVSVCKADEPAVRAWLQARFDYLVALWAPLTVSA